MRQPWGQQCELEPDLLHHLVSGTDIRRYAIPIRRQCILYPYRVANEHTTLLSYNELAANYPLTTTYLNSNRKKLEQRERGGFNDTAWYRFGRTQNLGIQSRIKLCVPRLVKHLYAAYDSQGQFYLDNVDVGGVTLKPTYGQLGLVYLLGLFNSKLFRWLFPLYSAPFRGGYLSANRQFIDPLPVRVINFADHADRARHDRVVALVERMLALHAELGRVKVPYERAAVEAQVAATDRQIDQLVYELYGLTDDEIRVVEGTPAGA